MVIPAKDTVKLAVEVVGIMFYNLRLGHDGNMATMVGMLIVEQKIRSISPEISAHALGVRLAAWHHIVAYIILSGTPFDKVTEYLINEVYETVKGCECGLYEEAR